jgi:hypothetical protein
VRRSTEVIISTCLSAAREQRFDLFLPLQSCGRAREILYNDAAGVRNRQAAHSRFIDRCQFPGHPIGTDHEKIHHEGRAGAIPVPAQNCTLLHAQALGRVPHGHTLDNGFVAIGYGS